MMTYYYYSKSAGIFIDVSGTDEYSEQDGEKVFASEKMQNDAIWWSPEKSDPNFGHNNFGIGIKANHMVRK